MVAINAYPSTLLALAPSIVGIVAAAIRASIANLGHNFHVQTDKNSPNTGPLNWTNHMAKVPDAEQYRYTNFRVVVIVVHMMELTSRISMMAWSELAG